MRHALILSFALVAGCAQVDGVVDSVKSGLSGLPVIGKGKDKGDSTGGAPVPGTEEAAPLPPAADSLPDTPPVAAVPKGADGRLGRTVTGLGDPAKTGLWMETPLVTVAGKGRVVWPSKGRWIAVALLPAGGEVTAGSRLSLDAFRALGAPLTDLIEVEVYASGG